MIIEGVARVMAEGDGIELAVENPPAAQEDEQANSEEEALDESLWLKSPRDILVTLFHEYTREVNPRRVVEQVGIAKLGFNLILLLVKLVGSGYNI